jgi:sulfate adenylyltransferase subunit 1
MDLIDYNHEKFKGIKEDILQLTQKNENTLHLLPVSALKGDNITIQSKNTPWYNGPALLELIENIDLVPSNQQENILQVQWVIRPQLKSHHDYRGFAGKVNSGCFRVGDEITVFKNQTN